MHFFNKCFSALYIDSLGILIFFRILSLPLFTFIVESIRWQEEGGVIFSKKFVQAALK